MQQSLLQAVELALNDDWDAAHEIAQDSNEVVAHWIHAVLHKIEGDEWNSRYWYRRTPHAYEEYADPKTELRAIATVLKGGS
ncbi:hypothetical protein ACKF11_05340 [Methylobacillus sp. Pita2]|uniref:hypothetical protein n=1 Tax=Methylobacillus sp. Pita2 TaxID=3383245 RepID=UPI0038B5D586